MKEDAFYGKYEKILNEDKFAADQICNMDESALRTVHKPSEYIAQKSNIQCSHKREIQLRVTYLQ